MFAYIIKAFSIDPFDTTEEFQAARSLRIDRSAVHQASGGSCGCFSQLLADVNHTVYDEFGIGNPGGPRAVRMAASVAEETVRVRRVPSQSSASGGSTGSAGTQQSPSPQPLVDIFEAARQGRASHLAEVEQREGSAALDAREDSPAGNSAAHWAALTGRLSVLRLLGARRCCGPQAANRLGQLPIHWACVNGQQGVVELLLTMSQAGDLNAVDGRGCSPLVVACQYGQTATAALLMGRGARLAVADSEGDTALHWAAYRDRPDLVALLVYSGLSPRLRDFHGQTPLHLAGLSGSLAVARDLCRRHGADLEALDRSSRTPLSLAEARGHADLVGFLRAEACARHSHPLVAFLDAGRLRLTGPPGRSRGPAACLILTCLLCVLPAYALRAWPLTQALHPGLHAAFLASAAVAAAAYALCLLANPGRLAPAPADYDRAMAAAAEGGAELARLCHSCRLVRPLRAKHCRLCDRCVRDMDHHCPYFDNCVGAGNRHWFALLTTASAICSIIGVYLSYECLHTTGLDFLTVAAMALTSFFLLVSVIGSVCSWYHAAVNITTNETTKRTRYPYLRDSKGCFRNPFDRGLASNLLEFFHLRSSESSQKQQQQYQPLLASNGAANGCANDVLDVV